MKGCRLRFWSSKDVVSLAVTVATSVAFTLSAALSFAPAARAKLPSETYVGSISFSPDGKRVVVGFKKHVAAVLEAPSGEIVRELNPAVLKPVDKRFTVKADTNMARDNWSPVSWSPDGRYIAVAHYQNVFIFDSKSGKLLKSKISKRAKDFDPERRWNPILPKDKKGSSVSDGWREYKSYVTGLDWSGDGKKLAISDANGVHVVDIVSGKELYTYEPLQHRSFVVSWSKDSTKLATISFNFNSGTKSLHIWNAKTGKTIKEFKGIKHLCWSPDSKHLAYDKHKGIVIYNAETDKVRNTISTKDDFPTFAWSPNGKYLAISDETQIVNIVNATTGKTVKSYKTSKGKRFVDIFPSVFAWSPDGKSLAIGLEDYELGFWRPGL